MQHPYYQQQQQPQSTDGFYFYQPQDESGQTLSYDPMASMQTNTTTTTTHPAPPKHNNNNNNININTNTTATHFYHSSEDYYHHSYEPPQSQQQQQQQQQPYTHVMTVGVATPPTSRTDSCGSLKPFGVDSNPQSSQDSPPHKQRGQKTLSSSSSYNNTVPQQQQQSQQQYPLQQPQQQQLFQHQRVPSPPVFRDHAPTVPQPQYHPQIYHQQEPPTSVQSPQMPTSSSSSPLPSLLRGGFVSHILNMLLPQDEMNVNTYGGNTAAVESIPLHRIRFGYPEDDIPLLQELGIFPQHIRSKALAVLNPFKSMSQEAVEDTDLAGPVVFAITLAFLLSLRGKLQFSTIYSHSVLGIIFTKVLLTLMTDHGVSLQFVISALGYCLIPSVVLAAFQSLLYWMFGYVGKTMLLPALLIVFWSAWCATSMFVNGLSMERQRYLIMYPIFLFYAVFAALTIF
ncbi:uncharacterized protein TM35_000021560 [Trypanosoma theileri]|uniref:Membrane protein YIP1 n=1 Tax=Trypanosoma theileri TaxID=67003 RepID=A0A1X0P8Q8_9TRYP|nr:uncharacterized protein TM35_000021560 [Trypanosoma theileri]ORC92830.1 hypothetical protein TM35_000021560 [Trypanosoma theileri]